jgi:CheY-like chemotaxis protein
VQTILVVDDEFGVVEVLVAALEDEGYRVVVAANGRHALEQVAEHGPDLVLVDFMMPLMSGVAMVQEMRRDPRHRRVPVIFMSAVSETILRESTTDYAGFLRKPFRASTLVSLVKRTLPPDEPR